MTTTDPLARGPTGGDGQVKPVGGQLARRHRSAAGLYLAKRAIVGRPLATGRGTKTLLPKRLALPVFSSDALSSVAYATEAALLVLVVASATGRKLLLPISAAIAVLLVLVVLSYRQTVRAYPNGGGSYVVASENLGRVPGLVAAASLLVDYVLTVAVSIAAGVLAITSAAPALSHERVALSLGFLAIVAVANIRGVRESARLFALPTYGFVGFGIAMIGTGFVECATGYCPHAAVPHPVAVGPMTAVSALVVLRAFASGCSALTGVEAIANGVTAFERPKPRNAAATLSILGLLAVTLFLGVSFLAYKTGARPSETASVISQTARAVFGTGGLGGAGYLGFQAFTFAILVLAANTAFQGFPRLTAILARDRFVPRAFANLGDRLVYSNGIAALALVAGVLLIAFRASPDSLLHLYLLGVFTAFTLSQVGMLRHWSRSRARGRRRSMLINGAGALGTGVVAVLVITTKFAQGAWMVTIAVPLLVAAFAAFHRGYAGARTRLRTGSPKATDVRPLSVVLTVADVDAATRAAWDYVRGLDGPEVRVVHATDGDAREVAARWSEHALTPLELIPARGSPAEAVRSYAAELRRASGDQVNVVIPELFGRRTMRTALRRTSEFRTAVTLHGEPDVVVTRVPTLATTLEPPGEEARTEAIVFVADVDDSVAHALAYAQALGPAERRAVHVALDPGEAERVQRDWERWEMPLALDVVPAPFRSLEEPVLEAVRAATAVPNTVAAVIVPTVASGSVTRDLLHNERSLYLEWLLRFEPHVVVTSVPLRRSLAADPAQPAPAHRRLIGTAEDPHRT